MALTGKFKFRKTLWGKILLQIEEELGNQAVYPGFAALQLHR